MERAVKGAKDHDSGTRVRRVVTASSLSYESRCRASFVEDSTVVLDMLLLGLG